MKDSEKKYTYNYYNSEIWFSGWLFTLAYLKLGFWKGLFALIAWPWFLGAALGG